MKRIEPWKVTHAFRECGELLPINEEIIKGFSKIIEENFKEWKELKQILDELPEGMLRSNVVMLMAKSASTPKELIVTVLLSKNDKKILDAIRYRTDTYFKGYASRQALAIEIFSLPSGEREDVYDELRGYLPPNVQ